MDAAGTSYTIRFTPGGKSLSTGDWSFDLATGKKTGSRLGSRHRLFPGLPRAGPCVLWGVAARVGRGDGKRGSEAGPALRLDSYADSSADGKTIRTVEASSIKRSANGGRGHRQACPQNPNRSLAKFLALSADGSVSAMLRWDEKLVVVKLSSGAIIARMRRSESPGLGNGPVRRRQTSRRGCRATKKKSCASGTWWLARNCVRCGRWMVSVVSPFRPTAKLWLPPRLDSIRLWDVATRKPLKGPVWKAKRRKYPFEESIYPNPSANNGNLIDPNANAKPSPAAGLAFSPSGKTLAVTSGFHREHHRAWFGPPDAGLIRLYDVATGRERFQLCQQEPVVAFSPDGRTLATGGHHDYAVYLWDAANGKQIAAWTGHRVRSRRWRSQRTAGRSFPAARIRRWYGI